MSSAGHAARGAWRRVGLLVGLLLTLTACASVRHAGVGEPVVVERLYLGRNVGGAEAVSDAEWKAFLDQAVTPRFKNGFTVSEARGHFLRADGVVEHEASFVLEVIHPVGTSAAADIAAIASEYKRRFHQEAVLHLVIPARAEF